MEPLTVGPGEELALARGALCISVDLELLWGVWDHVDATDVRNAEQHERVIVERLLQLLRRYEVAATWATVGRLLDDEPGFDGLRGSRVGWYAPELVEQIRAEPVGHEIASHGYAHVCFGGISADEARADLAAARAVHERLGIPWRSFVFPRNDIAHLDLVAESGIEVYRGVDAGLLEQVERRAPRLRPVANLASKAAALPPTVVLARPGPHGMVEIPSSLLLVGRNGARRIVTSAARRRQLRLGLEAAVRRNRVFHLWFHPSNFYVGMDAQLEVLETLLRSATDLRERGVLDVLLMGDFQR